MLLKNKVKHHDQQPTPTRDWSSERMGGTSIMRLHTSITTAQTLALYEGARWQHLYPRWFRFSFVQREDVGMGRPSLNTVGG